MAYLVAAISGLVTSAGFHPIGFWPAIIFGIGTLSYLNISRNYSLKSRLKLNFIFGLFFQIFSLLWIGTYVGAFAWVALVLMQATFFLVLSFALRPITFALSWVGLEFILRSFPFGGFGWSRIGFALTESPFNFLYPRVSVVGVAFLAVLLSSWVANRVRKMRWQSPTLLMLRSLIMILPLASIILIPVGVSEKSSLKVALVQGGQEEKLDNTFENANSALAKHFVATEKIPAKSVDLVIWPENAIMHDPTINSSTKAKLAQEISRIDAPILVNANLSDGTNGSLLLGAGPIQSYSKRYLTPFGEFMPFRPIVEKITDKAKLVNDYLPGNDPHLFQTKKGNFRTLICYELLSDKQARQEMSDSDFIVTQTNNATYFKTWQLEQELAIAQARSAETSRNSAYVSTTGVTAIIDERGRITNSIPKYRNEILVDQVKTREGATWATKFGGHLETGLLLLWLPLLLIERRRGF